MVPHPILESAASHLIVCWRRSRVDQTTNHHSDIQHAVLGCVALLQSDALTRSRHL